MLVLTIRTDKPEAELGLYNDSERLAYIAWPAHRELAETIHFKIKELLEKHGQSWPDVGGLAVFKGPGSFTGLRIGASVANALADSLQAPIVGASGDAWLQDGLAALAAGRNDHIVLPDYGAPPRTTTPRH